MKNIHLIDGEPCFTLRAKDKAALHTLQYYFGQCARLGSPQTHLEEINLLTEAFAAWADDHPYYMKVPD